MDLRNCPQCGKVFNFIRTNLCPECQEKDEQAFREIRKYITQHPGLLLLRLVKIRVLVKKRCCVFKGRASFCRSRTSE